MDSPDSLDVVLDFAIDKEIEANRFYVGLAKTMKNPAMRRVFEPCQRGAGHKASWRR